MKNMQLTHASVSYADIQGFTSICEMIEPTALSKTLSIYFKRMTRLVMIHGGIIDKFIGDCIMAVWGAPFKVARHELLCCLCALAFQREASRNPLKQEFANHGFDLKVRLGCASGNVLAGNIGSQNRVAYTVVGDAQVTANALEPYCKSWGIMVMCGEDSARECNDELVLRLLIRVKLPGRAKPIMCYEVMGVQPDAKVKKNRDNQSALSGSSANSDNSQRSFISSSAASYSSVATGTTEQFETAFSALPTHVDLEKLMVWHQKKTTVDDRTVTFAQLFSDVAREVIYRNFSLASKKLTEMLNDQNMAFHHKQHKSVSVLRNIINDGLAGKINANGEVGESDSFFVYA